MFNLFLRFEYVLQTAKEKCHHMHLNVIHAATGLQKFYKSKTARQLFRENKIRHRSLRSTSLSKGGTKNTTLETEHQKQA